MWISPEAPNRSGIHMIAQVKLPILMLRSVAELAKHGKMWFWYQDIFFSAAIFFTAPDKDPETRCRR
jgi:hypothetical protein